MKKNSNVDNVHVFKPDMRKVAHMRLTESSAKLMGTTPSQKHAQKIVDANPKLELAHQLFAGTKTAEELRIAGFEAIEIQIAGGIEALETPGLFKMHEKKCVTITL
ncbi:MAG: hypothetical protein JWO45_206 [Spartobacteria bacterium]|nr:hypothetical protein [Spartobacteria bacterium]